MPHQFLDRPDITVGIPTRNAGPSFRRLLESVHTQKTSLAVEVIALDSGSTDGTLGLLHDYGVRVIPIDQATFNWGAVRERLFEEARGGIVANLSQDAIPAREDWLENLIRPLEDEKVGVSSGSSIPDPDREFPQFQWEKNGYYYFTREIAHFVAKHGKGLSFGNAAVPRRVWEELHVDPQATGEDFQFQIKLREAGYEMAFPQDAPVLHHHNYRLKAVYRRCRNEGMALRDMGCPYREWDLAADLLSPRKYVQWLREATRGTLRSPAEWLYPVVRPVAVYAGSRFGRAYVWY